MNTSLGKSIGFMCIVMVAGLAGGCSSALETGYKPTLLGQPDAVRRAYYANPFTPEAKGAENPDQTAPTDIHKPHPY
jgi:hypothetical protein